MQASVLNGAVGAALLVLAVVDSADVVAQEPPRPSFTEWLSAVRSEALDRGIREDVVREALDSLDEPLPVVIERDRSQAEVVLPLETYIARRLTGGAVASGREMYARHRTLLEHIARDYGVPAPMILAIWGAESNFGRFSGVRPTIAALATLAWEPRRSTLFRRELFDALEILNRGDIELANMKGSWAGAMGQPQFMPSSYLEFAEDYDGDGRRDIWSTPADIFASIANYLRGHGWTAGEPWGREVRMSAEAVRTIAADVPRGNGTCQARRDMSTSLPLREWDRLGVRSSSGRRLPKGDIGAALVSGSTRHFLVYSNYAALLSYNCAHAYAISVGLLSDQLGKP